MDNELNRTSIYERLKKVFDNNGVDIDNYSINEIESIIYISLIIDIEDEFQIVFEEEFLDVNIIRNIDTLIDYIKETLEQEDYEIELSNLEHV